MLGRFLEISVEAHRIAESAAFYEGLGLVQAEVGETWSHRYGVFTDGQLVIGLHDYSFPSPSLTWVRPNLARHLDVLRDCVGDLAFAKVSEDEFNEAGFTDPDGQMVALLEARTYSPPEVARPGSTILGQFAEFSLPVTDLERSVDFWEPLGFVAVEKGREPFPWAALTSDTLNLGLYQQPRMRGPAITFREPDMDDRIAYLQAQGFTLDPGTPISWRPAEGAILTAPEGTRFYLLNGNVD